MLHSAEIYDARHNGTLAVSHGERPLKLAAVVPSQLVSHTCYACVARDHSGNLLAKEDLCVEVVAKDGKPWMQQLHSLHTSLLYLHECPSYDPNHKLPMTTTTGGCASCMSAVVLE